MNHNLKLLPPESAVLGLFDRTATTDAVLITPKLLASKSTYLFGQSAELTDSLPTALLLVILLKHRYLKLKVFMLYGTSCKAALAYAGPPPSARCGLMTLCQWMLQSRSLRDSPEIPKRRLARWICDRVCMWTFPHSETPVSKRAVDTLSSQLLGV